MDNYTDLDEYSDEDVRFKKILDETLEDYWANFESLWPKLKGRQAEIISLISVGYIKRKDIADKLNMKPGDVSRELKKISVKILKGSHNDTKARSKRR